MNLGITRKHASRALLDKNVARKFLQALEKKERGIALDASEQSAIQTIDAEIAKGKRLFIVPQTQNILRGYFEGNIKVESFLDRVEVIVSGRYYKRWARRLQEFGFTREDARVLSHGTFGTDDEERFIGVHEVLTFDKPLVNLFDEKRERIQAKLDAMKRDLEPPYDEAELPDVRLLGSEFGSTHK